MAALILWLIIQHIPSAREDRRQRLNSGKFRTIQVDVTAQMVNNFLHARGWCSATIAMATSSSQRPKNENWNRLACGAAVAVGCIFFLKTVRALRSGNLPFA
jgi:hypothetical protein